MTDRTESLDPYQPQESYDWDYEDEPTNRPRILWGRVLALGAALVLAFLIGRWTAPEAVSQGEFDEVRAELEDAQEEIATLEAQLAQEESPASPGATESPPDGDQGGGAAEGESYTVERGDNLRLIALDFYGDAALDDCIAEANDIADPSLLPVGDTLVIPPEEECT
jgi:nucleoid-associated protein YgaU